MSRVDVVVPCYNYGRYLRQCVDSILSQDGVDVRVLIIDDCSSDETPEVGSELAAADARVEFRRHEQNRGHIATYNEGLLEWVTAEYCLLISADDLLTPGALRRATSVMDAQPAISFSYGGQQLFTESPPRISSQPATDEVEVIAGMDFVRRMCESGANPVNTPTVVCRTHRLHRVGGYRPELPHTADMELWLRLGTVGDVAAVSACQAWKRAHPAQMQHEYVASKRDFLQRHLAFHLFTEASANFGDVPPEWLSAANSSLARQAFWTASCQFDRGNVDGVNDLLECARELDPTIVGEPSWNRMKWKRRLGLCGWKRMRPWVDWIRTSDSTTNARSI